MAFPIEMEKRNTLMAEMDELMKTAKMEKRNLTQSEQSKFSRIKAEIEKLDKELKKDEAAATIETSGAVNSAQAQEEIRAFVQYVRTGEARDLSSGASGAVIPKTIETQIIAKIKELAPIFERMTHYNVVGNLSIPSYPWDAHTTTFVEDFATITASGGTFLTVDLEAHAVASLALIGKNLINRTDVPVIDIIVQQIAMSISNFLNNEIINNTNARFSGTLQSVSKIVNNTGATISLDNLLDLQMAVPSPFQDNAAWLMHPTTFGAIRRLKDTTGVPLLAAGNSGISADLGFMLMGKPVLLDENMPLAGVGARSVFYGDFAGLVCNQNQALTTQVLQERYVDINAVAVITTMDLDISVGQSRALAALVGA